MFRLDQRDGIAELTLCHPPVNAIGGEWIGGFNGILDDLAARGDWRVLHIRSDQKAFCAGFDLNEMRASFAAADGPDRMAATVRDIQILYERIETLPQATLAEIGGAALGGGFELALACDFRIAADTAKLGLPEGKLGLLPAAGGTQRLTRLVGRGVAARIILAGEVVDGQTARELGMVQWVAPADRLAADARALAVRVAGSHGAALAAAKDCMKLADDPAADGFAAEIEATRKLLRTEETRARVRAFLEGRSERREKP